MAPEAASLEVQYGHDADLIPDGIQEDEWHSDFLPNDTHMRQRIGDVAWGPAIQIVGEAGEAGADSRSLNVVASSNVFKRDRAGSLTGPISTGTTVAIKLTANIQNCDTGVISWSGPAGITLYRDALCTLPLLGNEQNIYVRGDQFIAASTANGGSFTVTVVSTAPDPIYTFADTVTLFAIQDGADAFTIFLTNENHTFPADSAGTISDFGPGASQLRVYYGSTPLTFDNITTSTSSPAMAINTYRVTNIASTSGTMTFASATIVGNNYQFNPNSLGNNTATRTITIAAMVGGAVRTGIGTKTLSYSKAVAGATGAAGPTGTTGNQVYTVYGQFRSDRDSVYVNDAEADSYIWNEFAGTENSVVTV
jgi:hypothetical protein